MGAPRRFVDLHAHSTASDGSLPPAEVVRRADAARLAAVALTDHDTTGGLDEARAAAAGLPRLRLVEGIEVSARHCPGVMHILGLGVDAGSAAIQSLSAELRAARDERNPRIVARLQAMGVRIDMDDVRAVAGGHGRRAEDKPTVLGRLHIARAMVDGGHVATLEEAFDRYIGEGRPAYVEKDRMAPEQVIARLGKSGGACVLAHPVQLRCPHLRELGRLVRRLADVGLDGIEVYHSDHTDSQMRQYLEIASGLGLLTVGGSDFHGQGKPHVRLGRPRVPISVVAEPWASRWFGPPPRP